MTPINRFFTATLVLFGSLGLVIAGIVTGSKLATVPIMELYDVLQPVATLKVRELSRTSDSMTIHLTGERNFNRDCVYRGVFAYSKYGVVMRDINMVRTDKPATGQTKPKGKHDFGIWMLWPVDSASSFTVYVKYECAGRDVFVEAMEIRL